MIQGFSSGLLGNRELIYETDLPSFQRDFASLKTLDHGTGPAITFTRASGATYFDVNGVLQTASNDAPRFDHDPATGASRGLLIEEARTNSIRNSQAGGSTNGVIGSGGVAPTNWVTSSPTGIAREIIGTGTLNGFSYIDIKFSGTNTSGSSGSVLVSFDSTTQAVAANGQSWTGSAYVALVGGSFSGTTDGAVQIVERNVSGTFLASSQTSITSATSSLLRYSASRTFNQATTERTNVQVVATVANSSTIDLTLRIAAPQLEQGAFPTSYIPTTTAAATRSADSAVVTPISSFYNQSEGALFAEAREGGSDVLYGAASVDTDTSDNRIDIRRSNDASSIGFIVSTGAASQAQLFRTLSASAQTYKAVVAYATNDIAAALNGGAVTSDTSATLPTLTHLRIGGLAATAPSTGNAFHINGHIRKIAYWPKRLSNTLLQQLTT